ncbi:endonuclease domain-containing protein [Sphingomonas pruni]|uniref:endonuclease domain-containing protein n=1 Tax=Sphingomonas pruni TaxID=40683 RepID=UPI00247FE40A|nr:DUF559 domain-containing protein [Sphingomonas pruni]
MPQRVPPNVTRARQLRRDMTYPEILLWQRLRGSPGGFRFRRQHPIGADYVADFYCSSARLVIEVDGEVHASAGAQKGDTTRDAYMRSRGLDIVRIPAREVLGNADDVANSILSLAARPLHHRASPDGPPPRSGEEQE